jgi:hypothetical protein
MSKPQEVSAEWLAPEFLKAPDHPTPLRRKRHHAALIKA